MNKRKFVRAEEGKPPGISVVYYDTDGNKTVRYHKKNGKTGSIAWRNNNPGNLAWGTGRHAKATGCIGRAKDRPIFPDCGFCLVSRVRCDQRDREGCEQ